MKASAYPSLLATTVSFSFVCIAVAAPPLVLVQPTNQTVTLGFPVEIRLVANGATPLKFEWSLTRDGYTPRTVTVATTSEPFLRIPAATTNTAGSYTATISDFTGGPTVSNPAHIRVLAPRMHTNGTFIVDFYNNLIGTSLQLQSTANFINW
jgi:hypothetical protein